MLLLMVIGLAGHPAWAKRINGGLPGGVLVPPGVAPVPVPPQFDLTGYIEAATVDTNFNLCPNLPVKDPRLAGGTVTINGQVIIVPCNTILQMPAFATSWADLFTSAPADITPAGESGLALGDAFGVGSPGLLNMTWNDPSRTVTSYNAALPGMELHVVGNVINGEYVAGLMFISQQSLNAGQGVISCIDYATGELQVGGALQPTGAPCPPLVPGVTRVRMNDPVGRFGIRHGLPGDPAADVWEAGYDRRFTADTDNPTMHSALGYPICIPSVNPVNPITNPITGATITPGIDPKCPMYNRPVAPNCRSFDPLTLLPAFGPQPDGTYCTTWVMDMPGAHAADGFSTDPNVAAPLVIGDTIGFHGTLKADANGPYISAHTIEANLGIYTQPHTQPAYVSMEALIVGTGGGTVGGIAVESTSRVAWVGFSTDPTEAVDFYAVHQHPVTGAESDFFLQSYQPCCAPLGRFRSPVNNIGVFGEPTRNYRAVSRTMCQPPGINAPNAPAIQTRCMMAPPVVPDAGAGPATIAQNGNGLTVGKYLLPNFEFIFGENLTMGGPIIPANLQDLPFLFCGSGPLDGPGSASPLVGQLDPPPWALPMADPAFHATLCPQATSVGAAPGTPVAPPIQPLPAVINAFTATGAVIADGLPHPVTLTVTATNPNTPATLMSYSFNTAAAGVSFSCGTCIPSAGPSPYTVIATVTTTKTGTIAFNTVVNNGVLPSQVATASIVVASAASKPPVVTKQGSTQAGAVVTLNATAKADNGVTPITLAFQQTGGPTVGIGPVTLAGLPPNQVGTANFTVPVSAAQTQFTFVAIATDPTTGMTTTSNPITVKSPAILADVVTITSVAYRAIVSRVGAPAELGKLNIIATSNETNLNPVPVGMTMNTTLVNSSLPASVPGSTALPITVPLKYTPADLPGTLTPTCGATPCWVGDVTGVIQDTSKVPAVLVAPTSVTVRSSLGGNATVNQGNAVFTIR
ncbi:hypothetical protein GCM10028796_26610 [Ramlibacter monticola]|uniref:Uncharacterized protein n=1 Tax=Ramlibacter monticola TaxID=1926872 RepID=A0A936Z4V1_9BURK|nr:hypothetical protein [Ramlibacter monticola]MBL0393715.1 hypothetical protein [Ramlibacter monticola]